MGSASSGKQSRNVKPGLEEGVTESAFATMIVPQQQNHQIGTAANTTLVSPRAGLYENQRVLTEETFMPNKSELS